MTNQLEVTPTIIKSASASEAGPGEPLTYSLAVSNPGATFTADVSDVVPVGTAFAGIASCTPACTFDGTKVIWAGATINPGSTTFSFGVTITAIGGSTVTNVGTLDATTPDLAPIDSNQTVTAIGPALGIVKLNSPTGAVAAGDTITYTLVVSNESDVTATSVVVTDTVPSALNYVSCTGGDSCSQSGGVVTWTFASVGAASQTVGFTGTVKNPVPVGVTQIDNVAHVSASNEPAPVDSNTVSNAVSGLGSLTLVKSASPTTYSTVGTVIGYSYKLQNDGPVDLTAPYAVTDDKATVTCPQTPSPLAPGAFITCTASHTITQADIDAGSVTNVATGTAKDSITPFPTVTSDTDSETVTASQGPALSIDKSITSGDPYDSVGDLITYSYVVTNTGNVSLTGPVTVSDDKATVTCPAGDLVPAASVTCTATHTVTQADLDAGSVTNIASASASFGTTPVTSPTDTATATADQGPALTIVKSITAGDPYDSVGDTINYSYLVTNTGNVTIGAVAVSDDTVDAPPVCLATSLAPTESTTCTATYTVDPGRPRRGLGHQPSRRATGTPAGGTLVPPTDEATATADQSHALSIDKSSTTTEVTAAGQIVTYSYSVTNTGNVTLSGIVLADDQHGRPADLPGDDPGAVRDARRVRLPTR